MTNPGIGSDHPVSPLDREQIAHVEVGHTKVTPATARALAGTFVLLLVVLPAAEWLGVLGSGASAWAQLGGAPAAVATALERLTQSQPSASAWSRIVAANRAVLARLSAFESGLEDESRVGRLLRPQTQLVLSGRFGAGNERVYVGRDGWLFYRSDVEHVTGPGFLEPQALEARRASAAEYERVPQPDPRHAILQFHRDLEQRGIVLVVMPTPVKPTIHPGRLAAALDTAGAAPVQNASFAAFVAGLRGAGVRVFDPAPEIARAHLDSGRPQYLATDTHWRPEAMQQVARSLARFIASEIALPPVAPPGYEVEPREVRHAGDTALMLDLPPAQRLFPAERVELGFVVTATGEPWRASPEADVLVLGDSFSNIYSLPSMGWGESAGLVEHLSVALARPVDRITQNDAGAFATREALGRTAATGDGRLGGTRVVIWQFATRELSGGDWRVIVLP